MIVTRLLVIDWIVKFYDRKKTKWRTTRDSYTIDYLSVFHSKLIDNNTCNTGTIHKRNSDTNMWKTCRCM